MPEPAYLPGPVYPNGDAAGDLWWTGVLGSPVQIPANLTRGLSIIINPLVRLPWVFSAGDRPPWEKDPMLLNERSVTGGVPSLPKMSRESRFDFWSRWIRDAILHGQGIFSFDAKQDGQPETGSMLRHHVRNLQPAAVWTDSHPGWTFTFDGICWDVDSEGILRHPITGQEGRRLHFMRGHEGGILGQHMLELQAAAGVTKYAAELFDGTVPSGVLTTDQPVNQEQANATRDEWRRQQQKRSIAVLGNGAKYQQVVMSPVDAAVGSMMTLSNTQVAHMLELPAGMLDGQSGGSMTYANINDARRDFVDGTLASWAARVEESIGALLPWGQTMSIDFTEYTKTTTGGAAPPADPPPPVVPAPEEVSDDPDPA